MSIYTMSGFETERATLQFVDYIPLVSAVSGIARIVFGAMETIVGIPALPIQIGMRIVGMDNRFLFNLGLSNIIRGKISMIPFLGNLAMYTYDHAPHLKSDVQYLFGLSIYRT